VINTNAREFYVRIQFLRMSPTFAANWLQRTKQVSTDPKVQEVPGDSLHYPTEQKTL
ncbi:hypothetical protein NPIL_130631, partial [Nephila pilipes]